MNTYYGHFDESGKLHADGFRAALNALRARRVPVEMTVKECRRKRSNRANRYYHGVVLHLISDGLKDAGFEPLECAHEAVHEMLKLRFLRSDRPIGGDGEFITTIRSTAALSKEEFQEYIEHCVRFAAEYLGVSIPPPNEQMEIAA